MRKPPLGLPGRGACAPRRLSEHEVQSEVKAQHKRARSASEVATVPEASESCVPAKCVYGVCAYNGRRPCAQILCACKINHRAGRERREYDFAHCKAMGLFRINQSAGGV